MWTITCSQRGCVSALDAEREPKKCPVCRNPLLKGNAVRAMSSEPVTMPGADDPEPFAVVGALLTGEGAATVDTRPSESEPA